jgi:DNA-binding transcriptional LysR family regulator
MLNLRSIDLNLLPVFEAAYEEATLSRAAERLAMTQSAVSHALTRLRDVFSDELFVRSGRGVVPTPTADAIYARLRGALGIVRESVSATRGFDPKTSTRSFFISVSHPLGPMIGVRVREQLAIAAPGVTVSFSTRSRPVELDQALREGRVDAAVDWLMPGRGQFREATLFEDMMVAVVRMGHPAIQKVRTVKELNTLEFVSLRPRVEGDSPVPGIQHWLRVKLNFALEVSELLEVFMVTSQSDLAGLIPRSMLRVARDTFQLRPLPVEVTTKSVPIKLIWAASKDVDPAQAFIRKQIGLASRAVVGRGLR